MSRIGNALITVPQQVTVDIQSSVIKVKGPKGELTQLLHKLVAVEMTEDKLRVTRTHASKLARSLHGTYQKLIHNMVIGVTDGYKKNLELIGTGYRVAKQGKKIVLSLGYSHPIEFEGPEGIEIQIEGNNKIMISGADKQQVGQVAATIRSFRVPEPYKGKGIKYDDEIIRRKPGKAAKTA